VLVAPPADSPVTLVALGPARRATHVIYQVTRDEERNQGLFLLALPF
jgi:hypothetical protein